MKRIGGFVVHLFVLLVFFLWTLQAVFMLRGRLFQLEIIAVVGLLVLAVLGMTRLTQGSAAGVRAVYGIGLVNIIALSLVKLQLFFIPLIAAVVGIAASFGSNGETGGETRQEPEKVKEEAKEVPAEIKPKRKRGR